MKELVLSLDGRHLVIQGPPGSGKTWTSGRLIAHLIAHGKRSASPRRATRRSTTCSTRSTRRRPSSGSTSTGCKKASAGNPESYYDERARSRTSTDSGRRASTATSPPAPRGSSRDPEHDGTLDYLFVDEAGQVSLADALAMGDGGAERRPRRRPAAARPGDPGNAPVRQRRLGAAAPARRRRDRSRPTAASSSSARTGCTRTSAATSRRSSTRGGSSRRRSRRRGRRRSGRACATSRSSTRATGRSRRRRSTAVRAEVERLRAAGVTRRDGRLALQRAGERAPGGAARRARRHRRQVPGPGGGRRPLLDGELERRGRPARARVPALAQPAQRRDLARALPRLPRREPAAARGELHARSRRCGSRTRSAASSSWHKADTKSAQTRHRCSASLCCHARRCSAEARGRARASTSRRRVSAYRVSRSLRFRSIAGDERTAAPGGRASWRR